MFKNHGTWRLKDVKTLVLNDLMGGVYTYKFSGEYAREAILIDTDDHIEEGPKPKLVIETSYDKNHRQMSYLTNLVTSK